MQTKRGRAGVPARPLSKRFVRSASGGSIQIVIAHDRPRILALGRNVAVDELDDRHRRRIRRADAGLDDAGIAALAIGVTRAEHVEQLGELRVVEQAGVRKAAVGEAALLGERDQLFDIGAKLLGFRRSEEHTSELQSLMRISYAVFCLKKKTNKL